MQPPCIVEGCLRQAEPHYRKCSTCRKPTVPCAGGCGAPVYAGKGAGSVPTCYGCRRKRREAGCKEEGCFRPVQTKGYCQRHYNQHCGTERVCQNPVCGKPFRRTSRGKFCSIPCFQAELKNLFSVVPGVCANPVCGVAFAGIPHQRYCSKQCQWRRVGSPRDCPVCGKTFRPSKAMGNKGWTKTCSLSCGRSQGGRKQWPSSRIYVVDCAQCGTAFTGHGPRTRLCSTACRRKYNDPKVTSKRVSAQIMERYYSDPEYRARVLARSHARRADKLGLEGVESRAVLLTYLMERDKGRCRIPACSFGSRMVAPIGSKGPRRPSIDHVIPLSRGGHHTLANVQLSHYRCNLEKHNSGEGEQLLLFG